MGLLLWKEPRQHTGWKSFIVKAANMQDVTVWSWFHLGSILVPPGFHLGSILVPSGFHLGSILVPSCCTLLLAHLPCYLHHRPLSPILWIPRAFSVMYGEHFKPTCLSASRIARRGRAPHTLWAWTGPVGFQPSTLLILKTYRQPFSSLPSRAFLFKDDVKWLSEHSITPVTPRVCISVVIPPVYLK